MTSETGTTKITYARYYADATATMQILGDIVVKSKLNIADGSRGRMASTNFEKNIALPALVARKKTLITDINKHFVSKSVNTRILSLQIDEEGQTEAQSRSWADFSFVLSIEGVSLLVPVNIKYTAGTSKDNVGGWEALAFCLFGEDNTGKGVKGTFENGNFADGAWLTAPVSDYFLLSFIHGEDKATDSFKTSSLMSLGEHERTFNNSQPFPVQARIANNVNAVSVTMQEARKAICQWIIRNKLAKLRAEVARYEAIEQDFEKVLKGM